MNNIRRRLLTSSTYQMHQVMRYQIIIGFYRHDLYERRCTHF